MVTSKRDRPAWTVKHPHAAGIDVGSRSHFVAVGKGCAEECVREFGCHTEHLDEMAEWLLECGVQTVAMESTGVYWIAVYEVLQGRGLDVWLVNPKHTRNVSGRKSDVLDCQWMQQLHTYGLLNRAFRPSQEVCEVRELMRMRETLLQERTRPRRRRWGWRAPNARWGRITAGWC